MTQEEATTIHTGIRQNYRSFEEKLGCHNCKTDNPQWSKHSDVFALILLVLLGWTIGYSLFGSDVVGIHSQMFSLVVSAFRSLLTYC